MTIWSARVENSSQEMTFDDFSQSLRAADPPDELTPALRGLWWDAKGDWVRAHECAQVDGSQAGSWVHAYLHRKEGDRDNAAYWYRRAGKPVSGAALEEEWQSILKELLT
jgi:hypothetical protein